MRDLLVIYDEDKEYGAKLCDALNADATFPFTVERAENPEELREAVEIDGAEVVLTSVKDIAPEGAKTVIFLSDVPGPATGIPTIFKYQPIGRIRQEILKAQRVFVDADSAAEKRITGPAWLGIASPVGRSLKTSFALVLGQLLAQTEKTLYVNLEPCPAFSALFGKRFSHDLSELFYAGMKEDWDGTGEFTETVHGLDVLAPAAVPEDVYQTDPVFLRTVLRKYAETNGFETVILDLGTEFRVMEAFLPTLSRMYVPGRKEPLAEAKVTEFREWLARVTDPSFEEKVEALTLPAPGLFSRGKADPEQLLFTELGDYVRTLLGGMY